MLKYTFPRSANFYIRRNSIRCLNVISSNCFNKSMVEVNDCPSLVDAITKVSKELSYPFPKNFVIDSAKKFLINHVEFSVQELISNNFDGDSASRLVYGEKGIGKSRSLIASVITSAFKHPNLKTVYVEYVGDDYRPVSEIIAEVIGIDKSSSIQMCLDHLKTTNQYSLIVVDEVDQIYRQNKTEIGRKILDQLAELGAQKSGRTYTILCGSASVTPLLINKNGLRDPDIVKEFPQLENAPSLNGSKYPTLRVYKNENLMSDFDLAMSHFGVESQDARKEI